MYSYQLSILDELKKNVSSSHHDLLYQSCQNFNLSMGMKKSAKAASLLQIEQKKKSNTFSLSTSEGKTYESVLVLVQCVCK